MANIGDMVVRIVGDNTELNKAIDKSEAKLEKFGKTAEKVGKGLFVFVTAPLVALGVAAVKSSADMEMLQASFTTMLGSASKATELMTNLKAMAAATPFETGDLANASKTLLAYRVSADQVIPVLSMLGDIAGGNSQKLGTMAEVFGRVQGNGKLMGEELNRLIDVGFNPLTVISEKTGKSMTVLRSEMEKGKISSAMLSEAFKTATSEGGQFYNGMAIASTTLTGLISTLNDDFGSMGRALVASVMPALKDLVKDVSKFANVITNLSPETHRMILGIMGIAAAIGPAVLAINGTVKAVSALKLALLAMQGAGGPIILVLTAVTAIGAKLIEIEANGNEVRRSLKEMWEFDSAQSAAENYDRLAKLLPLVNKSFADAKNLTGQEAVFAKAMAEDSAKKYNIFARQVVLQRESEAASAAAAKAAQDAAAKAQADAAAKAAAEEATAQRVADARASIVNILKAEQTEVDKLKITLAELNSVQWAAGSTKENERLAAIKIVSAKIIEARGAEAQSALELAISAQTEIDSVMQKSFDDANAIEIAKNKLIMDQADALIAAQQEMDGIMLQSETEAKDKSIAIEQEKAAAKIEIQKTARYLMMSAGAVEVAMLEEEKANAIAAAEEVGVSTAEISAFYDKKISQAKLTVSAETAAKINANAEKEAASNKRLFDSVLTMAGTLVNAFTGFLDASLSSMEVTHAREMAILDKSIAATQKAADEKRAIEEKKYQADLKALDAAEQERLYALGLTEAATLEQYDLEIAKAQEAGDAETAAELQKARSILAINLEYDAKKAALEAKETARANARAKLDETLAKKKIALEKKQKQEAYKLELASFLVNQRFSAAKAVIDTAGAIIGFLANPGGTAGAAMSIAAGVAGALQLATIFGQPPPAPPSFAEGGIVMPSMGGTLAQVAEAGQPEVIFPLDKLNQFLNGNNKITGGDNGGQIRLVVNLDSRPLLDKIFDATRNRTVLIDAGAVV